MQKLTVEAKLANRLLNEIKVFLLEVVLLLEGGHKVGLRHRDHNVEAEIVTQHIVGKWVTLGLTCV